MGYPGKTTKEIRGEHIVIRARTYKVLLIGSVLFTLASAMLPSASGQTHASRRHLWMNKSLSAGRRADLLIGAMTLKDKVALVHGISRKTHHFKGYVGYVPANPRLHIPALKLADGRAGVGNGAKGVTLLPAPIAAASSWDPSLLETYGRIIGKEQWGKGTNVELGPTIDVVRVP